MTGAEGVRLVPVDLEVHRDELLALNVEYMTWIAQVSEELVGLRFRDVAGMDVRTYTEDSLDALVTSAQRQGAFYLVEVDGALVGMGALHRFEDGVAELRRMYVRPAYRGSRLGGRVMARLLEDARSLGFDWIRLESGPFMTAAHHLYEEAGFVDRDPYEGAEVPKELWPHWRFMELALRRD